MGVEAEWVPGGPLGGVFGVVVGAEALFAASIVVGMLIDCKVYMGMDTIFGVKACCYICPVSTVFLSSRSESIVQKAWTRRRQWCDIAKYK